MSAEKEAKELRDITGTRSYSTISGGWIVPEQEQVVVQKRKLNFNINTASWRWKLGFSTVFLLVYIFGGGIVFRIIEGHHEVSNNVTLNRPVEWDYLNCLYFCTSTLTTIGYGDISPNTTMGKIFNVFYILTGLFIVGFAIGTLGESVVRAVETILKGKLSKWWVSEKTLNLQLRPIGYEQPSIGKLKARSSQFIWKNLSYLLAIGLFLFWWLIGAIMFMLTESWSFFSSMYFCIITLTTIGYGDMVVTSITGRILFIPYAFIGLGSLVYLINETGRKFIWRVSRKKEDQLVVLTDISRSLGFLKDQLHHEKVEEKKEEEEEEELPEIKVENAVAVAAELRKLADTVEKMAGTLQREKERWRVIESQTNFSEAQLNA